MLRKMFQGGSSRKQGPMLAMRDVDEEPPSDAPMHPCEWPSENFMDRAGIKEEFNAYLRNADLVSFEEEKCNQYHYLTSSFVRRQKEDMLLPERRQMSMRGGRRPLVATLQLRRR